MNTRTDEPSTQTRRSGLDVAVERFAAALGAEHVTTDPLQVRQFRDPYAHPAWVEHQPAAVVSPASTEEVQEVVRIAAGTGVHLWPISQGRNNGYGGPAPRVGGGVVVNLRRMNRILELDAELAYAVVQPGVRFFDLFEEIRRRRLPLWPSIPDLGWGSIVGNTLDHGIGFTPLGDHQARQCGMEVVLADGSLLRTGLGAMTTARTGALRKYSYGPSADGIFMQSNFGIVTEMGCWLVPQPEVYVAADVVVERDEDLAALVEAVRPLLLDGTIPNHPIVYNTALVAGALSDVPRSHWQQEPGPLTQETLLQMRAETGCGAWFMRFALYGPAAVVDAQQALCEQALARVPSARTSLRRMDGATAVDELLERARSHTPPAGPDGAVARLRQQSDSTQAGVPSLDLLEHLSWDEQGAGGHLDYSPVAPLDGRSAQDLCDFLDGACRDLGVDFAVSLMLTSRVMIAVVSLWFATADEAGTRAAYTTVRSLVHRGAEQGYGAYRTHLEHMDDVAATYDWNDHAGLRLAERLKDVLDPQGVLAPGKQGIWPGSMRDPADRPLRPLGTHVDDGTVD
jgi:4-cresol dehydrogenase (hydroxylating) flavoprotein subunit